MRLTAALAASLALTGVAAAQCWVQYDASLGTPPTQQGFVLTTLDNPPAPVVTGGRLHIGPTTPNQMVYFERTDFPIVFSAGFSIEANVEIVASDCATNGALTPAPRHGFQIVVTDDTGRIALVQLCDSTIELANHANLPIDGTNVKTVAYPVLGNQLALRFDASATGFELRVNGVLQLSVPLGQVVYAPNSRDLWFGDGTVHAGDDSYVSSFRASGSVLSAYGTAKVNSQGCTPSIGSNGTASASSAAAFNVTATNVINNKSGLLFYGFTSAANPFQGGWMLVAPPTFRTPVQGSNGSPPPDNCSGSYSFDFNPLIQGGTNPNLVGGATVYCEFWYRDPVSPSTTGLTNALAFSICP